mmetsp:Transcript_25503/g.39284  ORF Transcript_25503/g.39284 Transcript_25503/m.39284 type:complete len:108 (+) Transcript_25503:723-1046(+)
MIRVGTAVYSPSNFFNHSCQPNAYSKFSGKKQFIIANQDIKAGEEVLISYINHGQPERFMRQKLLKENYFFKCECPRCKRQKIQDEESQPDLYEKRYFQLDQCPDSV